SRRDVFALHCFAILRLLRAFANVFFEMISMEALMIGISGLRGTVGGTLTPAVINQITSAFACWLNEAQKPLNGTHFRVVFGRDSRPSGGWVRDAAVAALAASGIEVIDLDIVTT